MAYLLADAAAVRPNYLAAWGLWNGMLLLFHIKTSVMENPFELIFDKLNNIENLLKAVMKKDNGTIVVTEVFNLKQAAEYVSLSKSAIYKKTSERNIPHFKQGKKLYFKRSELDTWLTELKITTHAEIEKQANDYIKRKNRFKF
ncbi:MAG: helix-turn-helix domain-containing protein [Proteobacteria bacterium]|nr:helix-turn-helix domain-containing protein [Pseudomonadota bacterium]